MNTSPYLQSAARRAGIHPKPVMPLLELNPAMIHIPPPIRRRAHRSWFTVALIVTVAISGSAALLIANNI